VKRQSIYELVFLAFTATACGAPEMTGADAKETPAVQLTTTHPSLESSDTTPPQSSVVIQGQVDPGGVYHSDVSVMVQATDDASGVATISWAMSGAQTGSGQQNASSCWAPIINTEGTTTLTYYAKDNAGNQEAAHTLNITMSRTTQICREVQLNDFNLFVSGNYSGGHDVRGKVAAGGDISMRYFSLGAGLQANDTENVLVAGGALNILDGGIFGNAHYGTTTTANGTVTFSRGALSQDTSFDIYGRASDVESLSGLISMATVNGKTTFQSWGGLYLQGTDTKVNVFEVKATQLSATRYFSLKVPSGSVAVVNVTGYSAQIANFSNSYSGVDATGVLFNFANASYLNIFNYGVFGTILAPYADIDFNSGSFDGGIYSYSLTGNGEGHLAPLRSFTICADGVDT
jgi:choice-of-anchor A domain-containing protein